MRRLADACRAPALSGAAMSPHYRSVRKERASESARHGRIRRISVAIRRGVPRYDARMCDRRMSVLSVVLLASTVLFTVAELPSRAAAQSGGRAGVLMADEAGRFAR